MSSFHWSYTVISILITVATSTELVPERFLRPRDFNHHPFTDVGGPPTPKPLAALTQSNPYAVLSQKKPREGREFARQDVIFYPSPHPSVLPTRKYLETNEVGSYSDPNRTIPKNYAFSYIVRDHQSGDDFSHSQAHNGKATRGQYRVKLPDGRVQVVSYTADHKGYRADVQYEDDVGLKRSNDILRQSQIIMTLNVLPGQAQKTYEKYRSQAAPYHLVSKYNSESSNPLTNHGTGHLKLVLSPTPTPTEAAHYFDYVNDYVPSAKPTPRSQTKDQFVSPTPIYDGQYVSTTSGYDDQYRHKIITSTPTPYVHEPYSASQNYEVLASPSTDQIFSSPRTLINSAAIRRNQPVEQEQVIYKYV